MTLVPHAMTGKAALATWLALTYLSAADRALAHGSMETPLSRVYSCFLEGPENPKSAACREAVRVGGTQALYDWNGVNQGNANGRHREILPDGQLCGAGKPSHRGLDLARSDWPATTIAPNPNGGFEFVYRATAPHATRRFDFYVTRDGYDPTRPLSWSDLEATPFCSIDSVTLENGRYRMTCPLPQAKSGRHLLYNIWERSDSPEAFYACIDVVFAGGGGMTTTWRELGRVRAQQDLAVGSKVTLRLFDSQFRDVEAYSITLGQGMGEAEAWPFHLAQSVNSQSSLVRVGVLGANGTISPARSALDNRVYTQSETSYTTQVDIETVVAGPGSREQGSGDPGTGDPGTGDPGTGDPGAGGDPGSGETAPWQAAATYVAGDQVTHRGATYRAKWWSRGDEPVVIPEAPWQTPWALVAGTSDPAPGDESWQAGIAYVAGDIVSHRSARYRAKWWSRGFAPDTPVENAWETPWEPLS